MFAKGNTSISYSYVRHDLYMHMSNQIFYVQDEARKLGWKSQMTDLEFRKKDETYIIWIHKWPMSETGQR